MASWRKSIEGYSLTVSKGAHLFRAYFRSHIIWIIIKIHKKFSFYRTKPMEEECLPFLKECVVHVGCGAVSGFLDCNGGHR